MIKKTYKMLIFVMCLVFGMSTFGGCKKKADDDENTLEIYATSAGYGIEWLYDLEKIFEANNPGTNVVITYDVGVELAEDKIKSGPKATTADLFFSLEDWQSLILSGSNGVAGYDRALEDLTEFLDEKDESGNSLREQISSTLLNDLAVETETQKGNSEYTVKNYVLPWASACTGLVYNKNLFARNGWDLPRTSDELISLADQIKEKKLIAFANESSTGYIGYLAQAMFAQYVGAEDYAKYYSPIIEDDWKMYADNASTGGDWYYGRLYAAKVMEQICCLDYGRMSSYVKEDGYDRAQGRLVAAQAAMAINGDWFDNEMSVAIDGAHKAGNDYASGMMKTPVISALSDRLSYWNKLLPSHETYNKAIASKNEVGQKLVLCEELLCGLVDYVDGKTSVLPSVQDGEKTITATAADAEIVKAARGVYNSLGSGHTIVIPAYATAKNLAKKFVRLLYSEEGIKAFLNRTKGGILPVKYDVKSWEGYESSTDFQKDIYNIVSNGTPIKFMDGLFYALPRVPVKFYDYSQSSSNYKTPEKEIADTSLTRSRYIDFMKNLGIF